MSFLNELKVSLESDNCGDIDLSVSELNKYYNSLEELRELKEIIISSNSLESNIDCLDLTIDNISNTFNIDVSNESTTLAKIEKLTVALETLGFNPWQALKNTVRDTWASFKGYDYFKSIYTKPVFNRAFKDVFSDIDYMYGVFKGVPEFVTVLDKEINQTRMTTDTNRTVMYHKGKLINSVQFMMDSIDVVDSLINRARKGLDDKESITEMLNDINFEKYARSLPNIKFVIKDGKPGIEIVDTEEGSDVTGREVFDQCLDLSKKLNNIGSRIRKLERKLKDTVADVEDKNSGALCQIVSQLGIALFSRGLQNIGILTDSLMQACDRAVRDPSVVDKITSKQEEVSENWKKKRKKYDWKWIIVSILLYKVSWVFPVVGLLMIAVNVQAITQYEDSSLQTEA